MPLFFNKNALKNKVQTYKRKLEGLVQNRKRKLSQNEIADEASEESFPASDSPGYRSKTSEDRTR